ncbi:hypothetical protein D8674_034997 [Pyrus ussuriensis x Pyrus communis]|uniref:Uncharacterized protein n=1 Tax=Pyrus ussuriensis x Pyrus communis TaxID=2448454 RepID=A0A5N5GFU0_9ROSA|nr:hypothetical protein D8674_034997 [Pyrus ussuriensis x Pyrus communis]
MGVPDDSSHSIKGDMVLVITLLRHSMGIVGGNCGNPVCIFLEQTKWVSKALCARFSHTPLFCANCPIASRLFDLCHTKAQAKQITWATSQVMHIEADVATLRRLCQTAETLEVTKSSG